MDSWWPRDSALILPSDLMTELRRVVYNAQRWQRLKIFARNIYSNSNIMTDNWIYSSTKQRK